MSNKWGYFFGVCLLVLIIGLFVGMGMYMGHQAHVENTTIVAEGVVESMYIDVSGKVFSTKTTYFVIISGKAVKVSESAYGVVQIGDLVRVFSSGRMVILS